MLRWSLRQCCAAAALALCGAAGCATVPAQTDIERRSLAMSVISRWTDPAQLLALRLMEEHGLPDRIELDRLTWQERGGWKRVVVSARTPCREGGGPDELLEQAVDYAVPVGAEDGLAALGGRVRVSRDGLELSACSASEKLNRLALNLAVDIAREERDPRDVPLFYDRAARLSAAGKSSPYMERLLFVPAAVQPAR